MLTDVLGGVAVPHTEASGVCFHSFAWSPSGLLVAGALQRVAWRRGV